MSFTPFPRMKWSSVVPVWYVASFVPLAFSATIIKLFSRPSLPQRPSSQELLYFFLYVSYLGSPDCSLVTSERHQAIKDINKSYDTLVDLFESFESFLRRLDIYTKIPSTTAITEVIVKILAELLYYLPCDRTGQTRSI